MDNYLLNAVEAQAVEDMALLNEQAALLHDRAARVHEEQAREMTVKGEHGEAARRERLAVRARDLAAVERARADQVLARQAEMTAQLEGHI